ncbi:molybdopterin-dependent oxidoreductase [Bailinhaonella thermotolerans]|uniref:Xanthine dehydrogenase family protein molybdopterin-binding subunit n=1 Tax=Bailinhaonella thermotolerans TaxID=1070861 RepID=A0A3A4AD26_9ACTN|nr:molybdopterin cofactor-binding domain-containing protein [Bailinhaonella thermotolerans]RJL27216.1 xanthine dehydrogenase family protein molybdopterin-binding subunit [Bailinhaonella thermotolerans]
MHDIVVRVNGRTVRGRVAGRRTLADFLREDCALTGTRVGCEEGECGSCTVLLDGRAVLACLVFAVQADGAEVVTVEGVGGPGEELAPVQRALREEHGVQCGFCTPGVVMAATGLLRDGVPEDEGGLRHALAGNLCRCTGYQGIVRAVRRAAAETPPPSPGAATPGEGGAPGAAGAPPYDPGGGDAGRGPYGVAGGPESGRGRPGEGARAERGRVGRREDARLLTGQGRFVADVALPGMAHAAFVRSPVARGRITRLDAGRARGLDGVVAVLTAADLNPRAGSLRATPMLGVKGPALTPLAEGRVRFAGEPVALVVAESRYAAEDAAELVELEIEPLPPVLDVRRAAEDAEHLVYDELDTNVNEQMTFPTRPRLRAALESSPHVVRATFRQQRLANAPLETRGIVASYALGELHAWISTQNPHEARLAISRATGVPEHNVRVTARDVGGSFGQKFWTGRDELAVAVAARLLGRPVKWIEDRRENLTTAGHGRSDEGECAFALDGEGRFLGWYLDHLEDSGAYPTGVIGGAGPFVGMMFTGPYKVPMHAFRFRSVRTNTCPRAAYRGPWTFATVAREQMIDEVAREVGLDPVELRRRNVVGAGDLPYTMPTRMVLDRVTPAETLEQAVALLGYDEFRRERRRAFEREGRLLGAGVALYVEPSGGGTMDPIGSDTATVRVAPSGAVTVHLATGSHGQGVETTMAQLVSEELGVPLEDVAVVQGDTASTPYGRGTGASGTAVITGGACRAACARVREKASRIAAHVLGADPGEVVAEGGVFRAGPGRALEWAELARLAYHDTGRLPPGETPGLEAAGSYKAPPITWSNACHACAVEVERETGRVRVLRYVVSEDCGVMINPMVVEGQIAGGVAQGVGAALFERAGYDAAGNPLAVSFAEYRLPTAAEAPEVRFGHVETPSDTPGGHKGMGQGGAVGSPPCVFNAVADALHLVGARVYETPLTPEAILATLP